MVIFNLFFGHKAIERLFTKIGLVLSKVADNLLWTPWLLFFLSILIYFFKQ